MDQPRGAREEPGARPGDPRAGGAAAAPPGPGCRAPRARCDGALRGDGGAAAGRRSEEHTSELQSLAYLVCRLLLEKKKQSTSYNLQAPLSKKTASAFTEMEPNAKFSSSDAAACNKLRTK